GGNTSWHENVVDDSDLVMAGQMNLGGAPSATSDKPEFNSDEDISCRQNFSIRDYVSMVRSNDITKNWPFSQKYLQICLDSGIKPVLPPFEHPQSVRDLIQEKVKLEAAFHGSDSPRNNVICGYTAANDCKHSGNRFFIRVAAKRTQTDQKSSRKIARRKSRQSVCVTLGDQDGITTCGEDGNQNRNGCDGVKTKTEEEIEDFKGQLREKNQTPKAITDISEHSEGLKPIAGTSEHSEGSNPIASTGDTELGIPCKSEYKEKDCVTITPQFSNGYKLSNSEITSKPNSEISSKTRRKRTDRPEILADIKNRFLKRNKQSKRMVTFEMKSQVHMDSFQKERRKQGHLIEQSKSDPGRTENLVISGSSSISDGMMVKVCPVCRTFSSTSNTALNAHIDHCLDAEPNTEITETSFTKHKTKVRKKRSMADICAVAPSRTLEDLVYTYSQEQHHPLCLDVLKWNDSNIRRAPRTPFCQVPKRHFDYADLNAKKLRSSSSLKMESLTKLQKELSVPEGKEKESGRTRKSKRSVFSNFIRGGKSLNSLDFDKSLDKAPRTSGAKHFSNEGIFQNKSQHISEEI
ncbi:hypothetical protein KI387_011212, partial [Taxus chinensis]